jgi:hypothetical protein
MYSKCRGAVVFLESEIKMLVEGVHQVRVVP